MTGFDPRALRDAFGSFMTGVTVVTTCDGTGKPIGFTANSFTSVSIDPPLLLVCPGRSLSSFDEFAACERFAVSILGENQRDVALTFASFKGDRFAVTGWRPDAHGMPLIDDAIASFSCRTRSLTDAGDHGILLGEITDFDHSGRRGLGYSAGQFFSLGLERDAATTPKPGQEAIAGVIVEYEGQVLLERTQHGLRPPQISLAGHQQVRPFLHAYLSKAGLNLSLGKAYSIFDDPARGFHYTYFRAHAADASTCGLGEFIALDDLNQETIISPAHAAMLNRYAIERRANSFSLYIGDAKAGDIHDLADED